ncbi:MAG: ArsR/SmtB family transcription factor [Promethearchaeota archaeon]
MNSIEPKTMDSKFEELNNKLAFLQDLILKMKLDFSLITRNQISSNSHTKLIKSTEEMINQFLDNRPKNCQVINQCSTIIQKRVMKILRVFSEQGHYEASILINRYINSIDSYLENGICQDSVCLDNFKLILINISDFLNTTKQNSISDFKELLKRENEFELFEGNEKEESKLMSVLGNENRIKILKELSKGRNYYTQLERIVGLKGGQFNFHLKELKDAKFVESSELDKSYSITIKGLSALKMLFEVIKQT